MKNLKVYLDISELFSKLTRTQFAEHSSRFGKSSNDKEAFYGKEQPPY
jgi:hypothetical protein